MKELIIGMVPIAINQTLKSVANSDMRDEPIQEKTRITFIDHFTCITKICTTYLQQNRYNYVPETLMQKNNMEIIGNDMRIK